MLKEVLENFIKYKALYWVKMETGQNCTRGLNCTKIFLHEGTKLHKDNFARVTIFARE